MLIVSEIDPFPYWTERSIKPQLAVRVRTADGLTGWGESGFTYRERAVEGAVRHLAQLVVGRSAMDTGSIWQECYRRHYFEGDRSCGAALSAIDVALHDIKAQALGIPVWQLLGGRHRDRIECFPTTQGDTVQAMLVSARQLAERGFRALRLHVLPVGRDGDRFDPREAVALTAEAVAQARAAVGDAMFLGIDLHHRFSTAEASAFCQRLAPGTLDYVEEPIRAQNAESYRALRGMTPIPFAVGEEFTSKWEFRPLLEAGLVQFARIDLAMIGGFTEAAKVAGWCEAHYVDIMPHNPLGPINTAATLHFAAALPNLAALEARRHQVEDPLGVDAHLFPVQPVMEGTAFAVPQGPGLGLQVDEEALAEESRRFRTGDGPRLTRPDGSYTNA